MISIFHFHQDVGFSFMLDPRFPHDTLFITFEQDFRWYERDCLNVDEWLPMCVHTNTSKYVTHEFMSMTIEGAAAEDSHGANPSLEGERRGKKENQQWLGGACHTTHQAIGAGCGVLSRDLRSGGFVQPCIAQWPRGGGVVRVQLLRQEMELEGGLRGLRLTRHMLHEGVGVGAPDGHEKPSATALRHVAEGDALPGLRPP